MFDALAETLYTLEQRSPLLGELDRTRFEFAVAAGMDRVARCVESSDSVLTPSLIEALHAELSTALPGRTSSTFEDQGINRSWSSFCAALDDWGREFSNLGELAGSEVCILSQLGWGRHLPSLGFASGWLVMNGYRQRWGEEPVRPPSLRMDAMVEALLQSGPPDWDLSALRGARRLFLPMDQPVHLEAKVAASRRRRSDCEPTANKVHARSGAAAWNDGWALELTVESALLGVTPLAIELGDGAEPPPLDRLPTDEQIVGLLGLLAKERLFPEGDAETDAGWMKRSAVRGLLLVVAPGGGAWDGYVRFGDGSADAWFGSIAGSE
ncbi:MAG: hypothetical protein ACRBN8_15070 [Nannocystales bacterium]